MTIIKVVIASLFLLFHLPQQMSAKALVSKLNRREPELFYAIKQEKIKEVRQFIKQGHDVNLMNLSGETPLLLAIERQRIDIITELVTAGAILNIPNRQGTTPLLKAIEKKNLNIVKLLVEAGATVDLIGKRGMKPVFRAIQLQQLNILKYLLEKGATFENSSYAFEKYVVALLAVEQRPNIAIFRYLFEQQNIALSSQHQNYILNKIIRYDDTEIFHFLLQKGIKFNSDNIIYAISTKSPETLNIMMRNGEFQKEVLFYPESRFRNEINYTNNEILHILIKYKETRDFIKNYKQDMFLNAIHNDKPELLGFLRKLGADLNFEYKNGDTPLFIAIKKNRFNAVEFLLEQKNCFFIPVINVNTRNKEGKTIFDIASRGKMESILERYKTKSR